MSEKSYGAVIGHGKTFKAAVESFGNYEPATGENSTVALGSSIISLDAKNEEVLGLSNTYKERVAERKVVFFTDEKSLRKLLSPIMSYVAGKYGKGSNQHRLVRALVMKMRGQRMVPVSTNPDAVTHSVSQLGYASVINNFKSLIVTCEGFGASYAPTNPNITTTSLNLIYADAEIKNEKVDTAYSLMVPKVDARHEAYVAFGVMCQCMKNFVKSQYGVSSSQFKIVKKIRI